VHSAPTTTRPPWALSPAPLVGVRTVGLWRPTSLAEVRTHRRQLRHLRSDADDDEALHGLALVFEELATNGVRHGGSPVEVTVRAADPGWLVEVSDAAVGCGPIPASGRAPGQGGLGLVIVARLSRACGWYVDGARKCVWAWFDPTLPTPRAAQVLGVLFPSVPLPGVPSPHGALASASSSG
jgi:anti-sigma regulatory factor (Ser/Thr protein kinase)